MLRHTNILRFFCCRPQVPRSVGGGGERSRGPRKTPLCRGEWALKNAAKCRPPPSVRWCVLCATKENGCTEIAVHGAIRRRAGAAGHNPWAAPVTPSRNWHVAMVSADLSLAVAAKVCCWTAPSGQVARWMAWMVRKQVTPRRAAALSLLRRSLCPLPDRAA